MLRSPIYPNDRFGRLTVVRQADDYISPGGTRYKKWECVCDCGNTVTVFASNLKQGATTSCGCRVKEIAAVLNATHNESATRLYDIWHTMKQRCGNPNATAYERYGGTGITIYREWNTYENFAKWATDNGYQDDLTLDRIDGSKGYEPSNCRWATPKEQARNRKSNRLIIYNGKQITVAELCELSKKTRRVTIRMLENGISPEDIVGG